MKPMGLYRLRKGLFGKCVLQELATFPPLLPNAPDPQWVDVRYDQAPTALVRFTESQKKIHELEEELAAK